MAEFLDNLGSGGWWLSVVLVGLALNLGSTYLYKKLDHAGASISEKWRARSAKSAKEFNDEVRKIATQPHLVPYYFQAEIRCRMQALQLSIFGLTFAVVLLLMLEFQQEALGLEVGRFFIQLAYLFPMLVAALATSLAQRSMRRASRLRSILNASRAVLGAPPVPR